MVLKYTDINYDVAPSELDEATCSETDPKKRAQILAKMKAEEVAEKYQDNWVLGADTIVVSESGEMLEKPKDEADARRMINLQSGKKSAVITGMCLVPPKSMGKKSEADIDIAYVRFHELYPEHIDSWISSGKWQGCSGGFRLEKAEGLIEGVEGDRSTVIGLSMPLFIALAKKIAMG